MKGDINEPYKFSPKNGSVLDTGDWEVASVGAAGLGWGPGGGILWFGFRSPSLEQYLKFAFVGGGPAAGAFGSLNNPSDVQFDCSRADWQPMAAAISEPFSSSNLCNANGRVSVISLGTPGKIGWGYTKLILTAIYSGQLRQGYLFDKFHYSGFGFGPGGVALGVLFGTWVFLGLPTPAELNNNWTAPVCEK